MFEPARASDRWMLLYLTARSARRCEFLTSSLYISVWVVGMVIIMKRFKRRFENHKSSTVSCEPLSPTLSPRAGKGSRTRLPSPSLPAGRDLGRGKLVPHVGFNLLIVALIAVLLGACKP